MAYILQHRRDTLANWERVNPVLADAEIGFVLEKDENGKQKSSLYKIGDGSTHWNDLPFFGFNGNIYDNFDGEDLHISVASRQSIIDKFIDKEKVEDLTNKGEDYSDVLVSKAALINKFTTIDENLQNNLSDIENLTADVSELNNLKPEIEKITGLETTTQSHAGDITTLKSDVTLLKSSPKLIITSEEDFERLDKYEENALYFTYKEKE